MCVRVFIVCACAFRKLLCAVAKVKIVCEEASRAGGKTDWEEVIGVSSIVKESKRGEDENGHFLSRPFWTQRSSLFGPRAGCRRGEGRKEGMGSLLCDSSSCYV